MDGSMYALAGNVKARARSSPALTDRPRVTDTRCSLRPGYSSQVATVGCRPLFRPAIMHGMAASHGIENHGDHEHDRRRAEDRKLVLSSVDVHAADGNRSGHFVGEQVWPEREDGGRHHVGLAKEHGDPGADDAAANAIGPARVRVLAPQYDQRREDEHV